MQKTLLTSFTTWRPHHYSNSSDDLLARVSEARCQPFHYIRRLPVDFQLAPRKVLDGLDELKPDILICCGMAEKRERLSIESRAVLGGKTMETGVELNALIDGLPMVEISHDAGEFVCNALYFEVLSYLERQQKQSRCIFVHVPVLTARNTAPMQSSLLSIVNRISATWAITRDTPGVTETTLSCGKMATYGDRCAKTASTCPQGGEHSSD